MIGFVGLPPSLRIALGVVMETMHFHIVQTGLFLRTTLFRIKGVPMSNLAPMRNCPGGTRLA